MRIGVLAPIPTGLFKDNTMVFIEGFEKLGHEVISVNVVNDDGTFLYIDSSKNNADKLKTCDVLWTPFETEAPLGLYFKHEYNLPLVSHFEIIVPSRINLESAETYWYDSVASFQDEYYKNFRLYAKAVLAADVKTITCETHRRKMEKLIGKKITEHMYIRPYALDNELLDSHRDNTIQEKNQIFCSMRLVNHKKTSHIIKALSMIENAPLLVIVGYGIELDNLKRFAAELNVNVDFKDMCSDKDRDKCLQESMFCVYPWAWLPVGEAAYYSKPSIVYDSSDTRERLFDIPIYVPNNNINLLSIAIKKFIDDEKLRKQKGQSAYDMINTGKCHTYKQLDACGIMIKLFEEAIKCNIQ